MNDRCLRGGRACGLIEFYGDAWMKWLHHSPYRRLSRSLDGRQMSGE